MRVACVTGMHRSGTSLLMRTANLLGVDLGDRDKILPSGADNVAGYWERRDILTVNDAILKHFGGSWDCLPHLPAGWEHQDDLANLRIQALTALESFSNNADVIGWKDPRLSILLPFWRTVADIDRTVVAIRHPAAVAASLQRRNGFTLQHATALWARYTLEALVNDPGTLVLRYSDILSDTEGVAQALAEHLRLPAPEVSTLEQIRDFAQPALAHQTEQLAPDSPEMRFASELFEEIVANPSDRDIDRFRALVASWNEAARFVSGQVGSQERRRNEERENAQRLREQQRRADELSRALARERQRAKQFDLAAEFERARRLRFKLDNEVQQRYDRLRNRRSVRLALFAARFVRLLFVLERWIRKRTRGNITSAGGKAATVRSMVRNQRSLRALPVRGGFRRGRWQRYALSFLRSRGTHRATVDAEKNAATDRERTVTFLDTFRDAMPVTIIIPIYNAVDDLRQCIASVRRNTTFQAKLLLVDDASTDPRVATYLDEMEGVEGVRVLRNTENRGFSGTVNRGIRESAGDVVVLNSDTEVTPRWLTNLVLAAYKNPTVGSATPLSDNAGAFSVPERGKRNATPAHLSRDEVGRLVTRTSQRVRPDTPTTNGMCMYLKRAMLDTMDLFDQESFPRGYGEENDFCMRAKKAGWQHIVDDATLVFHTGSMSYGEDKQALLKAGLAKVAELHPEYPKLVQPFLHGPQMRAVRETVRAAYDGAPPSCLPRILHVIHNGTGGVPVFNEDLARGLADRYEHLQLISDADFLTLRRYEDGRWVDIERRILEPSVTLLDHRHGSYRHEVARILEKYGVEIVHIQSLIHHAHDLPLTANAMGLAVVVTLHDYFLICPTIQLIDDQGRFCGGTCTPGQGKCRTGMPWVAADVPHLKHAWVSEWQRRLAEVLQVTDALVAPTEAARQAYLRAYSNLPAGRIKSIEHGVEVPGTRSEIALPRTDEPIRVLSLGNINYAKGAQALADVISLDANRGELDLHILGTVPPAYRSLGQQHGSYKREELPGLIEKINPALVVLLSPWGETFCYTLTEAWACGIPVVAADIGALGERVRAEGAGWVVDPHDPKAVYETILRAGRNGEIYRRAVAAARAHRPRSVAEMADDYDELYQNALMKRGLFIQSATSGVSTLRGDRLS